MKKWLILMNHFDCICMSYGLGPQSFDSNDWRIPELEHPAGMTILQSFSVCQSAFAAFCWTSSMLQPSRLKRLVNITCTPQTSSKRKTCFDLAKNDLCVVPCVCSAMIARRLYRLTLNLATSRLHGFFCKSSLTEPNDQPDICVTLEPASGTLTSKIYSGLIRRIGARAVPYSLYVHHLR